MSNKPNLPPAVNPPSQGGGKPPDVDQPPSAGQPPQTPSGGGQGQDKKRVRIRKPGKWVDVDVDAEVRKGRFRYVKFTDDDGLETYWIAPE